MARLTNKEKSLFWLGWTLAACVIGLLQILIALLVTPARADEWRLIEANSVDIYYRSYMPGSREPYVTQNGLPNRQVGKALDFDLKNNLFWGLGYLDLLAHSKTDEDTKEGGGQFRSVGLQFRVGANLADWLQVGYWHHSVHVLDTEYKPGFGVEDAVELRVNVYRRKP